MKVIFKTFLLVAIFSAADSRAQDDSVLDETFASRGGVSVTHREFDASIAHIPESDRAAFLRDGRRLERALATLLTQKQLASDAMAAGFDEDPKIQDRMQIAAMRALAEAWLDNYLDNRPDAKYEELAREQYLLDPSRFQTEKRIDVAHILVSTEERSADEALAIAQEIGKQLREDPASWDTLVMKYSEDPGLASNSGLYKSVKMGDMARPFENAAFALNVGEISEPVLTQYGYHIIRLDAVHEPRQQEFEEVKAFLVDRQKQNHRRRARDQYLNELGAPATDLPPENLLKMLSRYFDEDQLNLSESE